MFYKRKMIFLPIIVSIFAIVNTYENMLSYNRMEVAYMSKYVKIYVNPYGDKTDLFKKDCISIDEGLTVLVGANGTGKTTLLHCLSESLEKDNIPVASFNNLYDGGRYNIDYFLDKENFEMASLSATSSEGENIMVSLGEFCAKLKRFIEKGQFNKYHTFPSKNDTVSKSNERWMLIDATDSGLSIDNIVELKKLFYFILEDSKQKGISLFIIVSANEYEMANQESCFDVRKGEYIHFASYEEYKDFILESREEKERRIKNEG